MDQAISAGSAQVGANVAMAGRDMENAKLSRPVASAGRQRTGISAGCHLPAPRLSRKVVGESFTMLSFSF